MSKKTDKTVLVERVFSSFHTFIFRFALMVSFLAIVLGILDVYFIHNKINGMLFLNATLGSALISLVCLVCDELKRRHINSVIVILVEFFFCYGAFIFVFNMNGSAIAASSFATPMMSFIRLTFAYVLIYVVVYILRVVYKAIKQRLLINSGTYDKVFKDTDEN